MYESIKMNCGDFHLYIFAFCDESLRILSNLKLDKTTVISLAEFETDELLNVKSSRTRGEYCWTCASSTILYCLQQFNLEHCTYLDADLYFYHNPQILLDEMGDNSVLLTEHYYSPQYDQTATAGKYCVQFITFKNDEHGLTALTWWCNECIKWCYARAENNKFGDQKYLDDWTTRFAKVYVSNNRGAGVAPWNVQQYSVDTFQSQLFITDKSTHKKYPLVFFHFHNIKILSSGKINRRLLEHYYFNRQVKENIINPYIRCLKNLSGSRSLSEQGVVEIRGIEFSLSYFFNRWIFSRERIGNRQKITFFRYIRVTFR